MKVRCPNCDKKHEVKPAHIRYSKTGKVCCSLECWYAWRKKRWIPHLRKLFHSRRKPRIRKVCVACGNTFKVRMSKKGSKFCGRECYEKWWSENSGGFVKTECHQCGNEFEIARYRLKRKKRDGSHAFCSRECYVKFWHEHVRKKALRCRSIKPNNAEKKLIPILKPYGFEYVGNGKFFVGTFNPDFVNRKTKKIVEHFGEYWHKHGTSKARIRYFRERGFDCLVVWSSAIKHKPEETLSRILKFAA